MKTYILMFSFILLAGGCQNYEKQLLGVSQTLADSKAEFLAEFLSSGLTPKALVSLKVTSDGLEQFSGHLAKSKSKKKTVRYLQKNKIQAPFPRYLFGTEQVEAISTKCRQAYFDLCPLAFSYYKQNRARVLKVLGELL